MFHAFSLAQIEPAQECSLLQLIDQVKGCKRQEHAYVVPGMAHLQHVTRPLNADIVQGEKVESPEQQDQYAAEGAEYGNTQVHDRVECDICHQLPIRGGYRHIRLLH